MMSSCGWLCVCAPTSIPAGASASRSDQVIIGRPPSPTPSSQLLVDPMQPVTTYIVAQSAWRVSTGSACSLKSANPSSNVITTVLSDASNFGSVRSAAYSVTVSAW